MNSSVAWNDGILKKKTLYIIHTCTLVHVQHCLCTHTLVTKETPDSGLQDVYIVLTNMYITY